MVMSLEEYLIQKTYYEKTYMEDEARPPIEVLGELFFAEQKKELQDLSGIRFAQGEIYYHYQDFEAAIFKWENIQNELGPWARKNMADAYLELELFSSAEEIYQSITSDSLVLNTEVALQLFGLYLAQTKLQEANQMIKNAVILNPGYPNVAKLARAFFEEQQDWASAIELAVNESIRTESLEWFSILNSYAEMGYTKSFKPAYFIPVLTVFAAVDVGVFETTVSSLWTSFKEDESYISFLHEVNQFILSSDLSQSHEWKSLSALYKSTYLDLISGKYSKSEIAKIVPQFLVAWLKIVDSSTAFFASSALLAWNDIFPGSSDSDQVHLAESILSEASNNNNLLREAIEFFQSIKNWAHEQQIKEDPTIEWMIRKLDDGDSRYVFLGGQDVSIDSIFTENASVGNPEGIVEWQLSDPISDEKKISIFNQNMVTGEIPPVILLADSLLFCIHANAPFTNHERSLLGKIKEQYPELHVDFVLVMQSATLAELEAQHLYDETKKQIEAEFPQSKLCTYYTDVNHNNQLAEFIYSHAEHGGGLRSRTTKILNMIRKTVAHLLQQQVKVENGLSESIQKDEDIVAKLQGSIHQLHDMEEEKVRVLQEAYQSIKEEIKADFLTAIPKLIKDSSEIVKEDSDFRKIHIELNIEMNNRIETYVKNSVLPIYHSSLQDWIAFSRRELNQSQEHLNEWNESFNTLIGEEKINLLGDFQILADWIRDADRMTSSIEVDIENILLRRTPSQVLLKGAGKFLGQSPKTMQFLQIRIKALFKMKTIWKQQSPFPLSFLDTLKYSRKRLGEICTFFIEIHLAY